MLLRTQASGTPAKFAEAQQGPEFFFLYTDRCRQDATARRTVTTRPGEFLSHRDLPRMTDYRVPHLVTD